ncbi:nuclear factor interleukin-3-regulated protein [Brachionichthys hirsutus]|uniref:nuclear factor interleukin-3-regulated protein n=1 Tax=Brachionichthys hirsutus TaxID=412623 RepID=UPI0036051275
MQSIKRERDSGGEDALVLAVALREADKDFGHTISAFSLDAKTTCRRKREFIPEEKKDTHYWERRRKNNEAAKRSRERRRFNDVVLENKVMALEDENASLKAELLSLKLQFGLGRAAAYTQEIHKLSGSTGCRELVSGDRQATGGGDLRSGCISVIKHSPHVAETGVSARARVGLCRTLAVKQEPSESGSYAQQRSGPYELYRNYISSPLSGVYSQPASFLPLTRSSSDSPRSSDDGAVSKSSDGEDEQRVPKGPSPSVADLTSVIVSTHKVPEATSSALPHKLRIKSRSAQIKVEAADPEYDSSAKSFSSVGVSEPRCRRPSQDSVYAQASPCSWPSQVTNMQRWTDWAERMRDGTPETRQDGCKKTRLTSSPGPNQTGQNTAAE